MPPESEQNIRKAAAKLTALPEAAATGWADIAAARFTDVADERLEAFIAQLGRRAQNKSVPARSPR